MRNHILNDFYSNMEGALYLLQNGIRFVVKLIGYDLNFNVSLVVTLGGLTIQVMSIDRFLPILGRSSVRSIYASYKVPREERQFIVFSVFCKLLKISVGDHN
jgi:hypothetical protein